MKGLFKYLSPFAPDQSGAVSVLYELGGIIIVTDAGGCTGNICGFDEPRWFTKSSAIYSAGLRDMDAILGRDEKLIEKLGGAVETTDANFIALIGTPVPAVIATDYKAICALSEKEYGIPTIYIETYGIDTYEQGQIKAYKAILNLLEKGKLEIKNGTELTPAGKLVEKLEQKRPSVPEVGIWGATPLDIPALDSMEMMRDRLLTSGHKSVACFGMGGGLPEFLNADSTSLNYVVSPSGLVPARALEKKYGIPYKTGFVLDQQPIVIQAADMTFGLMEQLYGIKMLIVHQQVFANAIRDLILMLHPSLGDGLHVASFFEMDEELMQENDFRAEGEEEFIKEVKSRGYALVFCDPVIQRALKDSGAGLINLPHYAVSGSMYAEEMDTFYFRDLVGNII
jgi:nitrogenase molybdenum-iron protein alpha/beta subunit